MILVTGAMGRIGSTAALTLHHAGHAVRAFVPLRSRVPALQESGVDLVEGDVRCE